jgi:2-phospho-L-lactate guanylyltransferase (CobY/MobA/RfbA family)
MDNGVAVVPDSGDGLSRAVEAAIAEHSLSDWAVVHADLPFVTSAALETFLTAADASGAALAPSVDGGTNVIAATGPFRFSYGAGSFHRHLARMQNAAVVSCPELAIEIDTEAHLNAVRSRPLPSSLQL